jgi:hypothetical protein
LFGRQIRSNFNQKGSIHMKTSRSFSMFLASAVVVTLCGAPALAGPAKDGPVFGYKGHGQQYAQIRNHDKGTRPVAHVPEIDAASGLAALAAVCGALAFAWERRRRA